MYGSPIYGADVSGSLTDQDVTVSVLIYLLKRVSVLLLRVSYAVSASCFSTRISHVHVCTHALAHVHTYRWVHACTHTTRSFCSASCTN